MKRHLIWIIAGTAAIGIAVPAFAAVQPSATPDDNRTPGEVRGNCDEAQHVADPACRTVTVAAPSASTTPTTIEITVPSVSAPSTTTAGTVPGTTTGNTVPDNTVAGTVPDNTVATSVPGDISGPCDEAEHADDPQCTGTATGDDQSGRHSGTDDDSGDDSGHHSGGDDDSGDDSGHHSGGDDSSGHGGGDDNSGHGGGDD